MEKLTHETFQYSKALKMNIYLTGNGGGTLIVHRSDATLLLLTVKYSHSPKQILKLLSSCRLFTLVQEK